MIELTQEQQKALESQKDAPPRVVNPRTGETYILIRSDVYETVRRLVEGYNRAGWDDPTLDVYEEYRDQK